MKNWILLAAIWMTGSSLAVQTPVSPWAEPQGAFFALTVPDADASAAWYQRHLGFQVITKGEAPNKVARGVEDYSWSNVSLTRAAKSAGAKGFARRASRKSTVS